MRYREVTQAAGPPATGLAMELEVRVKRIIKLVAVLFVLLLAAVVIVPLVVLAGLFIWLKLTEEADDEALELEQELEQDIATEESGTV